MQRKDLRHCGFKVNVADTIGSGDSFLAGFIHQLLNDAPVQNAFGFASGIGAFIASQFGACPSYEISQIKEMINSNSSIKAENFFIIIKINIYA